MSGTSVGQATCKAAVTVAYVGKGYQGFQRQPDHPTIEGELQKAFCKAGLVPTDETSSFVKAQWSRAARTDKGVSASGNVVSCMVQGGNQEDLVQMINSGLPPQIRVLGLEKLPVGFDARRSCSARRYEYLLPLWSLDPQVGVPRAAKAGQQASKEATEAKSVSDVHGGPAPAADAARQSSSKLLGAGLGAATGAGLGAATGAGTMHAVHDMAAPAADAARQAAESPSKLLGAGLGAATGAGTMHAVHDMAAPAADAARQAAESPSKLLGAGLGAATGAATDGVHDMAAVPLAKAAMADAGGCDTTDMAVVAAPVADAAGAHIAAAAAAAAVAGDAGGSAGAGAWQCVGVGASPAQAANGAEKNKRGRGWKSNHWRRDKRSRVARDGQVWVVGEAALKATAKAQQEAAESSFELDDTRLQHLNQVLSLFEGSHSFHNFTNEVVVPGSHDAIRTIHHFYCDGMVEVKLHTAGAAAEDVQAAMPSQASRVITDTPGPVNQHVHILKGQGMQCEDSAPHTTSFFVPAATTSEAMAGAAAPQSQAHAELQVAGGVSGGVALDSATVAPAAAGVATGAAAGLPDAHVVEGLQQGNAHAGMQQACPFPVDQQLAEPPMQNPLHEPSAAAAAAAAHIAPMSVTSIATCRSTVVRPSEGNSAATVCPPRVLQAGTEPLEAQGHADTHATLPPGDNSATTAASAVAAAGAEPAAAATVAAAAAGMQQAAMAGVAFPGRAAVRDTTFRYVRFVIQGQSFMMYQIRKMVGLALAVARGSACMECIPAALHPDNVRISVPMAPATGLLMDEAFYDRFNQEQAATGLSTAKHFSKEPVRPAADAFKEQCIYPGIASADPAEAWLFLKSLTEAAFGFSKWTPKHMEPGKDQQQPHTVGISAAAGTHSDEPAAITTITGSSSGLLVAGAVGSIDDSSARMVGSQEMYGAGSSVGHFGNKWGRGQT